MKSNTTTTTTTTTVLAIDRYSKAANGGFLHPSQGDVQLSWQHLTEPHMELRIIATAPSGRSKPKGKATTNSSLSQIQMTVTHRGALPSNGDITVLENLDLNQAALMTPLESGGAPIKALTKGLSIGFKYIIESQAGRQYHRFQVRFKRKDDIDKVRTLVSSLIPFKDAAACVLQTQTNLLNVPTINNSQQSMSQQFISQQFIPQQSMSQQSMSQQSMPQQLPPRSSHPYGYAQPFVETPYAPQLQSQSQGTSPVANSTPWKSLTLPPIRNRQESFQSSLFTPFPPTPPSSMPASADFSDPQSGQAQFSQAAMYPRPIGPQCAPVSKRPRLDFGATLSDDMDIIEDEAITQPKRPRFLPATNSQAIQTDSQDTASVSLNPDDEIAAFLSSTDTEAVERMQKQLEDPEVRALIHRLEPVIAQLKR